MDNTASEKVDNYVVSILRLSDDIGKMANRIGDMADRVGVMADRILETQRIQSKNLEITQEAIFTPRISLAAQRVSISTPQLCDEGSGLGASPCLVSWRSKSH